MPRMMMPTPMSRIPTVNAEESTVNEIVGFVEVPPVWKLDTPILPNAKDRMMTPMPTSKVPTSTKVCPERFAASAASDPLMPGLTWPDVPGAQPDAIPRFGALGAHRA